MSRDYKKTDNHGGRRGNGSSMLVGIFIGLALGLVIALMVAWYVNKMPSPFRPRAPGIRGEADKLLPSPTPPAMPATAPQPAAGADTGAQPKQRFDFYKILPSSTDNAVPDQPSPDKQKATAQDKQQAFFLQAGAFSSAPEADNMKARLALLGVEAVIQSSPNADNAMIHRVRIGPYTNVEELNRTRETLKESGIPTTLVRVPETGK